MALIPQDKIQDILSATRIEEVFMDSGIQLKKSGVSYTGVCPWCGDKKLSVHPPKQLFKCFGCSKGGKALTYLMDRPNNGMTYPDALKYLAQKFNVLI